jgi:catechol 2,3-dioxygenase-like lactoylglutathione lyase family enzyme
MERAIVFDHVAREVADVAAVVDWYLRVIPGTHVLYQDETWAFLDAAGVRLAFVRPEQHPGHLAWRVSEAELQRLAVEHGATVKPHRDGSRGFYLQDPTGNWIEFIAFPGESGRASAAQTSQQ